MINEEESNRKFSKTFSGKRLNTKSFYHGLKICKGLLQAIYLIVTINIWFNFLFEINPYCHQILMPWPRLVCHFISPCTYFGELPRYKNGNWFYSVTLHWVKQYQYQRYVFGAAKRYLRVIIILLYPWNTLVFSMLGPEG